MRIFTQEEASVKIGERFGRLVVAGAEFGVPDNRQHRIRKVVVHCDCGTWKVVRSESLTRKEISSCRCLHREVVSRTMTTHGNSNHPLYSVWSNMRRRCSNAKSRYFADYGGRGITVCNEWRESFNTFMVWAVANGYQRGLDIDRRDNDGNYSPDNCRFITRWENARNKRNTRMVTAFGETKALVAWGEDPRCVVFTKTLWSRIEYGWNPEKAMTIPVRYSKKTEVADG